MARKVILYIAQSLDGFIADKKGGVSFLDGYGDGGFKDFYKGIDTIIMGAVTYRQIVTQLFAGSWPYEGKTAYVFSRRKNKADKNVIFVKGPIKILTAKLKKQKGKAIWLEGGAALVKQALKAGIIDEFHIFTVPVILGEGLPLFSGPEKARLKLKKVYNVGQITCAIYGKSQKKGLK